jgi:hypothetical protein
MTAEVLVKGSMNLRVIICLLFTIEQHTKTNEYHLSTSCAFPEKYTLNPSAFKKGVARGIVSSSKRRGHSLNHEKALEVLDTSGFMSTKTCAKCDHVIIPAGKMGLNQLSPQRQHNELGYDGDEQTVLPYCLGCQRLCMERSPDEEEQIHVLIREAYPTHQPAHTGIRTEKQVQELKQAFENAGSPRPSPASKAEVDKIWTRNMETPDTDRRLKNPRVQV